MFSALAAWHPHTTIITAKCTHGRIKMQAAQTGAPLYGDTNSTHRVHCFSEFRSLAFLLGACSDSSMLWPKSCKGLCCDWSCEQNANWHPSAPSVPEICSVGFVHGLWETGLYKPHFQIRQCYRKNKIPAGNTRWEAIFLLPPAMRWGSLSLWQLFRSQKPGASQMPEQSLIYLLGPAGMWLGTLGIQILVKYRVKTKNKTSVLLCHFIDPCELQVPYPWNGNMNTSTS